MGAIFLASPPAVAWVLSSLGFLKRTQGNYEEAAAYYRDSLEIIRSSFGDQHPETLNMTNGLAFNLTLAGAFEEAAELHEATLAVQRRIHGDSHGVVATGLNLLGNALRRAGRYEEAEAAYMEAIQIREELSPGRNTTSIIYRSNLLRMLAAVAAVRQLAGAFEAAEALFRRMLTQLEILVGRGDPSYARSMNKLAIMIEAMGRREEAEDLYREAAEIAEAALGPEHPLAVEIRHNLESLNDRGAP